MKKQENNWFMKVMKSIPFWIVSVAYGILCSIEDLIAGNISDFIGVFIVAVILVFIPFAIYYIGYNNGIRNKESFK